MRIQSKGYSFLFAYLIAIFLNTVLARESSVKVTEQNNRLYAYPSNTLFEKLIRVPQGITVHQFSSHNKKGFNDDEETWLYFD